MKYLNYVLLTCLFIACNSDDDNNENPNEELDCIHVNYDEEFTITINDTVCFPDGNSFEVKSIEDQFCCCFCICVWEGELEIIVQPNNTTEGHDPFRIGSATYDLGNDIFEGYSVKDVQFTYEGEPDALPLCQGEYDASKVEVFMTISSS